MWHQQQKKLLIGDRIATGNLNPSFSIKHRVQTPYWSPSPCACQNKAPYNCVRDKGHSKTSEFHKKQIILKEKKERVLFISVNLSQLFIYVFCETPLTFGDLSQTAAERCQPLILEVKCIIAQHNERKWARPWEMDLNIAQACAPEVSTPKSIGMQTLHFQIKFANRSIGHLSTRQKGKHKHRHFCLRVSQVLDTTKI